jgi:hypothetical protein
MPLFRNLELSIRQGNCTWISLDRPNAPGWLVPKRALRNCASFRPCWARRAGHSSHLRHRRGALTTKNFKRDCPDLLVRISKGTGPSARMLLSAWTRANLIKEIDPAVRLGMSADDVLSCPFCHSHVCGSGASYGHHFHRFVRCGLTRPGRRYRAAPGQDRYDSGDRNTVQICERARTAGPHQATWL